jgi:hypothetical protein
MALYDVLIKQEFAGYKVIEADSAADAENKAWEMLRTGEIDTMDFDVETSINDIEEL